MPNQDIENLRARMLEAIQEFAPGTVIMTALYLFGSADPEVKAAKAAWHKGVEKAYAPLYPSHKDSDANS